MSLSSLLLSVCVIFPFVFRGALSRFTKKQSRALQELKDKVPHILNPPKNPQQLAHASSMAFKARIISAIIVLLILGINIATNVVPQYMAWASFFDTQGNTQLYSALRYAGLGWMVLAFIVLYRGHVAYLARLSHVSPYWNIPADIPPTALPFLYAQRDEASDLRLLRSDAYWFARDPETWANHLFAIGLVLSSCSWLLLGIFGIITFLYEPLIVKRDMVWALLYGPIYDTYRADRGGQFYCTCLNASEARFERMIRKKQAELAQFTPTTQTAMEHEQPQPPPYSQNPSWL